LITPPPAPPVDTSAILAEAQQQASQILEAAQREAARVAAEADSRAAEVERAAYERGYEEGVTGGRTAGEQQGIDLVRQVTAIVDEATQLHDAMLHEAEGEMVALCLE